MLVNDGPVSQSHDALRACTHTIAALSPATSSASAETKNAPNAGAVAAGYAAPTIAATALSAIETAARCAYPSPAAVSRAFAANLSASRPQAPT